MTSEQSRRAADPLCAVRLQPQRRALADGAGVLRALRPRGRARRVRRHRARPRRSGRPSSRRCARLASTSPAASRRSSRSRCSCTPIGRSRWAAATPAPTCRRMVEAWDIPDPAGRPIEEVRAIRDGIQAARPRADRRRDSRRSAADRTAHELRLARLLPMLDEEFADTQAPRRRSARAPTPSSTGFDGARVRSHVLTLAHRQTRECLRRETCDLIATRGRRREPEPDTVAVITDIHGNLPALQAALARIEELGIERVFCGGDLVGYGPHPNEVCALIAERDIPTIYGNYDYAIARDLEDCGCAYVTAARPRARAALGGLDARAHEPGVQGLHARPAVRPALPGRRRRRSPRARLAAEGQRVPVRGQARAACTSASRRPRATPCSCSATPTSRGCTSTAGCCSSTAARSASPRTATRAARSPSSTPRAGRRARRRSSASQYDADAVAAEVREAGLPGEFADKLLVAA